jgi:hypothetical protein
MKKILVCILFVVTFSLKLAFAGEFKTLIEFKAPEAKQGVAVDDSFIYVISDAQIAKYDKNTFKRVGLWQEQDDGPIKHLDSGMIFEGKLYCANSNYPDVPMTSSVEIWDPATMRHIASHSFGIYRGSCTWIDRYDGFWWGTFAHYEKWKSKTGKGSEWTTVVKFDNDFNELQSWVFPPEVVSQFIPMSNSGGSWGPDGYLYCTGHDSSEVYQMKIPERGSQLELISSIPISIKGQGIAWDRTEPGMLYGIRKKDRTVVKSSYIK